MTIPKPNETFSDDAASVLADFSATSDTLLIVFGGMAGRLSIPIFEFFNLTSPIQTKKLFLRDIQQVWYQHGLPDLADDFNGIAEYVRLQIKEQNAKRTVMI